MRLFNSFKSTMSHEEKVDQAYKCYKSEIVDIIFPHGKTQASNIIISLSKLLNSELSTITASGYYNLLVIYSEIWIRKTITNSPDEDILLILLDKHSDVIKSRNIAQSVLAFCVLNLKNNAFSLNTADDFEVLKSVDGLFMHNRNIAQSNETAQLENTSDPEFGLVPTKPIYTKGVEGSTKYLNSLETPTGEQIVWKRTKSLWFADINGMVDVYDISLSSGNLYKTLYINMYGTKAPTTAPAGFVFKTNTSPQTDNKIPLSDSPIHLSDTFKNNSTQPSQTLEKLFKKHDLHKRLKKYISIISVVAILALVLFVWFKDSSPYNLTGIITVELDKQGGYDGSDSISVRNGKNMPPATAPSKSGYIFGGYYSAPNGRGTQYYDCSMFSKQSWNKQNTNILYAYWLSASKRTYLSLDNLENYFTITMSADVLEYADTLKINCSVSPNPKSPALVFSESVSIKVGFITSPVNALIDDGTYDAEVTLQLRKSDGYQTLESVSVPFSSIPLQTTVYWNYVILSCDGFIYQ